MAPDASTRGARPVRITESTSSTVAAPERAWANPMAVARFIRNILPASARHRPTRAWEGRGAQTGEGIADDLRGPRGVLPRPELHLDADHRRRPRRLPRRGRSLSPRDRKSGVEGRSVSVRVGLGGRRLI